VSNLNSKEKLRYLQDENDLDEKGILVKITY